MTQELDQQLDPNPQSNSLQKLDKSKMNIPVIDFSLYNLGENSVLDEHLVDLGRQLKSSFTEIGFVYLKNTGITPEEVRASLGK